MGGKPEAYQGHRWGPGGVVRREGEAWVTRVTSTWECGNGGGGSVGNSSSAGWDWRRGGSCQGQVGGFDPEYLWWAGQGTHDVSLAEPMAIGFVGEKPLRPVVDGTDYERVQQPSDFAYTTRGEQYIPLDKVYALALEWGWGSKPSPPIHRI